jgi:hypothetical protein
MMAHFPAAA